MANRRLTEEELRLHDIIDRVWGRVAKWRSEIDWLRCRGEDDRADVLEEARQELEGDLRSATTVK